MDTDLKRVVDIALGGEQSDAGQKALDAYHEARKNLSVIERVNVVLGKKPKYIVSSSSSQEVNLTPYASNSTN